MKNNDFFALKNDTNHRNYIIPNNEKSDVSAPRKMTQITNNDVIEKKWHFFA